MKNPAFLAKLGAFVDVAEAEAPRAVYIALYMILACYHVGRERELARFLGGFSRLTMTGQQVHETPAAPPVRIQ